MISLCVLLGWSAVLHANPGEWDQLSVRVGTFQVARDTDMRVASEREGRVAAIDLEDDLDLPATGSVARLELSWRFARRHQLDLATFDLSRSTAATVDHELDLGLDPHAARPELDGHDAELERLAGHTELDGRVAGDFELRITKATYTLFLLATPRTDLGLTGGVYVADTRVELRETIAGNEAGEGLTTLLPVFGPTVAYEFAPRWTLHGSNETFNFRQGAVEGNIRDARLGVDYQLSNRTAFGLAYNDVRIRMHAEDRDRTGLFNWEYEGLFSFLRFEFGTG